MNELSFARSFIVTLCICWQACKSEMWMHGRRAVHEHRTQSISVTTGLCHWFVLCPLQTNPVWPWDRATAGVSRRAPSQGAPRGHRGITPKLWQGYPPICWENKCCPTIGHPIDWGNTAAGRRRQSERSLPTPASLQGGLLGVSVHPSLALSGLFKPCCQVNWLYLLHTFAYIWGPPFWQLFKQPTLYWDYMGLRTESDRCRCILKSEDDSRQCSIYCQ